MRPIVPLLALALVLTPSLSGCMGERTSSPEDELPEPGTIEGRVLGQEGTPVQGATVSLLASNTSATTDEGGDFEMTDIAPGPVTLTAYKEGYSTQTIRDDLGEGEHLQLEFRLVDAPSLDAYHTTISFQGSIECGMPAGVECPGAEQDPPEHWYEVDPGLQGILYEVTWDPPGDVEQELRLEAAAASGHACGETYETVTGGPVLRLHVEEGFPIAGGHQCARLWAAEDPMFQQTYELFVTLFYHEPMPDGFSAME